jgi:hypothetical protein
MVFEPVECATNLELRCESLFHTDSDCNDDSGIFRYRSFGTTLEAIEIRKNGEKEYVC